MWRAVANLLFRRWQQRAGNVMARMQKDRDPCADQERPELSEHTASSAPHWQRSARHGGIHPGWRLRSFGHGETPPAPAISGRRRVVHSGAIAHRTVVESETRSTIHPLVRSY